MLGVFGGGLGLDGGSYYALLWVAFASYLLILAAAGSLGPRVIWWSIVVAVIVFALAPPLISGDVFNYIAYARIGAEHGANPYVIEPNAFPGDPVFLHLGWPNAVSVYGPVFTLGSYLVGIASVSFALWAFKAVAAISLLAIAGLIGRAAPSRGLDPAGAMALVALNPLVLVHCVGGAHNDTLMMALATAGVCALLAGREATSGVALFGAVAVKASALLVAPFALIGADRRWRLVVGGLAAAVVVGMVSAAIFGSHVIDAFTLLGNNQETTTRYSIPATISRGLGVDSDPVRLVATILYAAGVLWLALWTWRGSDWVRAAAWAAFGILLATGWMLPWYLIWALPLAALARDRILVVGLLLLTAFELINRIPF